VEGKQDVRDGLLSPFYLHQASNRMLRERLVNLSWLP
jgi:hypothetical protein